MRYVVEKMLTFTQEKVISVLPFTPSLSFEILQTLSLRTL